MVVSNDVLVKVFLFLEILIKLEMRSTSKTNLTKQYKDIGIQMIQQSTISVVNILLNIWFISISSV